MKKLVAIIFLLIVSAVAAGEDKKLPTGWVKFKPQTIFTQTYITYKKGEIAGDYVFLIGNLDNGAKVAFLVGVKRWDSSEWMNFDDAAIWFDEYKCKSIQDIKMYGCVTWYKIYVRGWGYKSGGCIPGIIKYWTVTQGRAQNDYNTFRYIPPISKEKLK